MHKTMGLSFDDYLEIDALNWSLLKEMAKSPAHFAYRREHPREDTPRLAFGRAVHCAVLEPDRFPRDYVIYNGSRRYGKDWDQFSAANHDKTALRADEYETCLAVRDAVFAHKTARDMLRGDSEVTVEWEDAETGLRCKSRVDHVNEDGITDLKTTSSVDAWEFSAHSARMLYHSQLAFYHRGLPFPEYPRILAVEITPPYDVAVFRLTEDAMFTGDTQVSDLMTRFLLCTKDGTWPGRYDAEQELGLPSWMSIDPDSACDLGISVGGLRA